MPISDPNSKITAITLATSVLSLVNLISLNSAHGYSLTFDNGDFQSETDKLNDGFDGLGNTIGWEGVGSAAISGAYTGEIISFDESNQGIITTACPDGSGSLCVNRDDDPSSTTANIFNLG